MLDDIVSGLVGGLIGGAIGDGVIQGRAKRKARRFLAGEPIVFRAFLRRDGERMRRGRLTVSSGTEEASWAPWPRGGRSRVEMVLLGGKGFRDELGWWFSSVPAHGWRVRVADDDVASLLLEDRYFLAFAPIISLGAVPPRKPAGPSGQGRRLKRKRRFGRSG